MAYISWASSVFPIWQVDWLILFVPCEYVQWKDNIVLNIFKLLSEMWAAFPLEC